MLERFGDKACYTYNSAGIRTEKCIKNKATKYVVSGSTILSETTDGVSTIYYECVPENIASFRTAKKANLEYIGEVFYLCFRKGTH